MRTFLAFLLLAGIALAQDEDQATCPLEIEGLSSFSPDAIVQSMVWLMGDQRAEIPADGPALGIASGLRRGARRLTLRGLAGHLYLICYVGGYDAAAERMAPRAGRAGRTHCSEWAENNAPHIDPAKWEAAKRIPPQQVRQSARALLKQPGVPAVFRAGILMYQDFQKRHPRAGVHPVYALYISNLLGLMKLL